MGQIIEPRDVKVIFGVLYKNVSIFHEVMSLIETHYSPVDILSEEFSFVETDYYEEEMGPNLVRCYFSLRDPIPADCLPELKIQSNVWEERFTQDGKRRINIDPGYIGESNLVLASTKNFSQRVYLDRGIYAEVTMLYMRGDFTKLAWTYPDYYNHRDVFVEIRKRFREQLDDEFVDENGD